jgi:hypothetical protein
MCAKKVLFVPMVVTNRNNLSDRHPEKTRIPSVFIFGTVLAQKKIDEAPILQHYSYTLLRTRPVISNMM